jgi:hypothetical protein
MPLSLVVRLKKGADSIASEKGWSSGSINYDPEVYR